MTEFLTNNSIYLVFFITLIIWLGISYFLIRIDMKLTKLEKDIVSNNKEEQ